MTQHATNLIADIRRIHGIDLPPAKGEGKRHCGPFKAADTPPEGEDTTPDPKAPETPHSSDSRPHPDQPPTIDQERRRQLRLFYAMMACMFGLKRHD